MDELRSAPSASVAPFEAQAVFVRTKSVCASPPDLLTLRWAGEADETETGRLLHLRKEPSCYVSTEAWKTEGGRLVLELCEGADRLMVCVLGSEDGKWKLQCEELKAIEDR